LAGLYTALKRYAEAEPLYRQAVAILRDTGRNDSTETAVCLHNLGRLYLDWGKYDLAETFYRQARMIWVRLDQLRNPSALLCLRENADLFWRMQRPIEAAELEILLEAFSAR
jgi:tetratricopeptide (TPR) repeat protein